MKTGFSLCSFSFQKKTCNENRFFPVKNYTGKFLFSLQGWVCSEDTSNVESKKVVQESEMCDRVQFSFNDQNGINNIHNFTKQSLEKNGKPVYYTIRKSAKHQNIQTTVWWNHETNSWLSQTIINSLTPSSGNKITKTKIKISH